MSARRSLLGLGLALPAACFLLVGCDAGLGDPFLRTGTWSPSDVNNTNIAAMVANPSHLKRGVDDPVSPAQLSAAAVDRLLNNRVKPLPTTDIAQVGQSGANSGAAAAPEAGGTGSGAAASQ